MTDVWSMVDIIYPKLRIFTDGARTASFIINRLKHGKKQPKQKKRMDPGEDKPQWSPRGDYSRYTWEDSVLSGQREEDERDSRGDNSHTPKPTCFPSLDADSEPNVNISDIKLIPIQYKAKTGHVKTATTRSWMKSLRSRIISVFQRLSFCIPRKTVS